MNICLNCNKETKNKKYCSLECFFKKNKCWNKGLTKETDERVRRISEIVSKKQLGIKESMETSNKLSKIKLGHPYYGGSRKCLEGCTCGRHFISKKTINKLKKHWKNLPCEIKQERIRKALHIPNNRPNLWEKKLNELLQLEFPNEWKYVGDGSLILNDKNPDFINVNGKKCIIELWGEYFHKKDFPEDRQKIFEAVGYKTLVIWCSELKNSKDIVAKVKCLLN